MTPTTDLQKLLAEATEGPWQIEDPLDLGPTVYQSTGKAFYDEHEVAFCRWPESKSDLPRKAVLANARLIAMAPDLAARVIELEAENKRLRESLKRMLLEFDFLIEANLIRDDRNDVIFVEARAALKGGEI
jgi:hypothetical protein